MMEAARSNETFIIYIRLRGVTFQKTAFFALCEIINKDYIRPELCRVAILNLQVQSNKTLRRREASVYCKIEGRC